MVPYITKIAKDWVNIYSQSDISENAEDPLIIFELLIDSSVSFSWSLILETISYDKKGTSLDMLIFGPLQSLIQRKGNECIDLIEEETVTNPRLKWALGAIVNKDLPSDIWQRLTAVKGPAWKVFSGNAPPYPDAE
jgi:hypothetical protein